MLFAENIQQACLAALARLEEGDSGNLGISWNALSGAVEKGTHGLRTGTIEVLNFGPPSLQIQGLAGAMMAVAARDEPEELLRAVRLCGRLVWEECAGIGPVIAFVFSLARFTYHSLGVSPVTPIDSRVCSCV